MEIKKMLAGSCAFFLAYMAVDYLLDNKIDYAMAITYTIGYFVGMFIYYKIISKKK